MSQLGWKHKINSLVDIRRDEIGLTSLMFAYYFLIIASHTILITIRDALFIGEVGAGKLPYVYIGIALVAGIVMQGYARLAQATNRSRLIIAINLFFISNVLVFWRLFRYELPWLSYMLYIWAGIFSAISITQFWLIANDAFNPRQAKRLFGFVLSGGTLGAILAGGLSRGLVHTIGTQNLFLVTALQLLGCAIIAGQINFQGLAAGDSSNIPSADQNIGSAFTSIRRNKHLTLLTMIVGVTVLATNLVDFQFKSLINQTYKATDALTSFFGAYHAYINIITIFFQLLVTGRVLKRFGVGVAILVMPVGLFLGSATILFHPVLWAGVFVKTCDDIFSRSIYRWGTEILYIPIPGSVKLKAKTFIDIVVARALKGVAGFLLLFLTLVGSLSIRQLSIPIIALLAVWVFLCIRIYREYIASIEATLRKRSLNIDTLTVDLTDSSTMNQLLPLLDSENERQILYALELLQDVRNPDLVERVQSLCHHSSPEVRVQALRILFNIGIPRLTPQIEALLKDESEEVRTEAMHYVSVYGEVPSAQRLHSFLTDSDYKMKSAAIVCITRYGNDEERALLTQDFIEQLLLEKEPHRRLARLGAAKALGSLYGNPSLENHLLDLFCDEDIDVVKQAVLSAGNTGCVNFVSPLVDMLGEPTVRVHVRDSLATYGPAILDTLALTMTDKRLPMPVRRQIPKVISMIPHQDSVDVLLSHLDQDEMDMRYKIIRALGELRPVQFGIQFNSNLVEGYVAKGIKDYYHLLLISDALNVGSPTTKRDAGTQRHGDAETRRHGDSPPRSDASRFLQQALRERLELFMEMIFRLLGLIYPQESMYNAYRGVTSHNPRIRASAVELLDNILNRNAKRMLFPIIDNSSKMVFMERASALWALQSMTEEDAIVALIDGRDNWLKACALYTVGEEGMVEFQKYVDVARGSSNPLIRESAELAWRELNKQL